MAELVLLHWQSSARSPQIAPLAETKLDVVWHLLRAWRDLWWPAARVLTGNSWVLPAGPVGPLTTASRANEHSHTSNKTLQASGRGRSAAVDLSLARRLCAGWAVRLNSPTASWASTQRRSTHPTSFISSIDQITKSCRRASEHISCLIRPSG